MPTAAELALLIAAKNETGPTFKQVQNDLRRMQNAMADTSKVKALQQEILRIGEAFSKATDPKDMARLRSELASVQNELKNLRTGAEHASTGLGDIIAQGAKFGLGVVGVVGLTQGIAKLGESALDTVKSASDLNETINKAQVVFGASAQSVLKFGETAATSIGQSKQQAIEAAGTYGTLFTTMGLGQQAAADMSIQMVKLASDMASFNNIPIDVALEKIRAGLVGEAEPLRTVGVLLDEASVKAKAMQMGFEGVNGELTQAEKVQARYALILEQSKIQQGDFARTSDGMANASRIIQANLADLSAEIGNVLLPFAANATSVFAKTLPNAISSAKPAFEAAGIWLRAIGDALGFIGSVAGNAAAGIAGVGAAAANAAVQQGTYASILSTTNAELERMFSLENLNLVEQGKRIPVRKAAAEAEAAAVAAAFEKQKDAANANTRAWREMEREYQNAAQSANLAAEVSRSVGLGIGLLPDQLERQLNLLQQNTAEAKRFGSAAQSAFEKAEDRAADLEQTMDQKVRQTLYDIAEIAEESGQRWIEKWFEVDAAIKDVQRSAQQAKIDLWRQEDITADVNRRRQALNEALSAEEKLFRQRMDDEEFAHEMAVQLNRINEREQRDLAKATSEEERQQIRQRAQEDREELERTKRERADEMEWRRQQEEKLATFQKNQAEQRAALEKQLHDEEVKRRLDAIDIEAEKRIKAINDDWDQWQKSNAAKTEKSIEEAKKRAAGELTAWAEEFYKKLPDEAGAAAEEIKKRVEAALGAALTRVNGGPSGGSSGSPEPNAGYWSGGEYIDPRHQPGGDIFEQWKQNEPEQYREWAEEHGVALQSGGIVTRPTLALIGEAGPEAVVPLRLRSGGGAVIDYDLLATKIASALAGVRIEMDGQKVARIIAPQIPYVNARSIG